ncbi:MAG: hypothetical protein IJP28_03150 [Erysipelotrichales bacterium]|nr:hypothetical protein [Erysipelotrichales bacterium]
MYSQDIIGYEIWIPSFADSNEDGVGDLQGILSKLDYLSSLGINTIWLSPFHESMQIDSGYDVSDYYSVYPLYGTLDQLQTLIQEAHSRDIRVIMDLVLNHTAKDHPWFEASRHNEVGYEDLYIWRKHPNNWLSFLGQSAWTYDEVKEEYYLHIFDEAQPDLNWKHPRVMECMIEVANYYLDLGIDGFRLDAVAHLGKDQTFMDSDQCRRGEVDSSPFSNKDEVLTYLQCWKSGLKRECILIGEIGGDVSVERSLEYLNHDTGVMDYAFTFDHCWLNGMYGKIVPCQERDHTLIDSKLFIQSYLRYYDRFQEQANMMLYWLNHDHPRLVTQYGSERYYDRSAKMLATLLYFLHGSIFLYYGEELGMTNTHKTSITQFKDHQAHLFYQESTLSKEEKLFHLNRMNRDAGRGCIDWKVAQDQVEDPSSIYHEYRKILVFRSSHRELISTRNVHFIPNRESIIEYVRKTKEEELHIIVNVSDQYLPYHECTLENGKYITGEAWKGSELPPYYYCAYYVKKGK